jgi:alpha-L-fucosidase
MSNAWRPSARLGAAVGLACTLALSTLAVDLRAEGPYEPTRESLDTHPLPQWWRDAKFGIFIHWGVYAVPAYALPGLPFIGYAEWYWAMQQIPGTPTWLHHLLTYGADVVYDDFIPRFRAERWDPSEWIRLFEDAGARYFVLTSKHHDGFLLWPSETTGRDAGDLGPQRDLIGELFAAAEGSRVRPGLYYSLPEWFNPAPKKITLSPEKALTNQTQLVNEAINLVAFGPKQARNAYTQLPVPYTGQAPVDDYAAGVVVPQIEELVHRYHPWILWCDIGGDSTYFQSNRWIADYYNDSAAARPEGVVVNDRCGDDTTHADFDTNEYDFFTGPGTAPVTEDTRGMGSSFGYNAQETDADLSSVDELVDALVDSVSKGRNLLLNIGPRADGTIPVEMQDRLRGIGAWLAINGEAIYGSHAWIKNAENDLRFTVGADGTFYVIALSWPGQELTIESPVPLCSSAVITLLGSNGQPLAYRREGSKLVVTLPAGGDQRLATRSENAFVLRIR